MKKIILFLFVFLFPLVNAVTLSMSPQQINFIGNVNEKLCEEVTLKTEGEAVLLGEDKWAEKGYSERKLKQHILDSDELKLDLEYPNNIKINNNEKINVCIVGKNKGDYHGILLYRVEGKPVRVGIWMNVSLDGSVSKITGNVIGEKKDFNFFFIAPIILLIVLGFLLWMLKRKGKKL